MATTKERPSKAALDVSEQNDEALAIRQGRYSVSESTPVQVAAVKAAPSGLRSETEGTSSTASSTTESALTATTSEQSDDDAVAVVLGKHDNEQQQRQQRQEYSNILQQDREDGFKLRVKFTRTVEEAMIRNLFWQRLEDSRVAAATAANSTSSSTPPSSQFSLLLITGPCGSGKTHLATTALNRLLDDSGGGGKLIQGSFDKGQLQAPSPYSALTMALCEWTTIMLQQDEATIVAKRRAILQAIGDDESSLMLLRSMIPSIGPILGTLPDDTSKPTSNGYCPTNNSNTMCGAAIIKSKEAMQRFTFVLTSFLQAICTPAQPLVLLLNDLHYADPCSLDILANVISTTPGLFLVGTCDDAGMSGKCYLSSKLREIEDHVNACLVHVTVGDLTETEVCSLLHDTLNRADDDDDDGGDDSVQALAKLVLEQTQGSIGYITAFLYWLVKSELLDQHEANRPWKWNVDEIRLHLPAQRMDVVDFVGSHFLEELPSDMKEALKVAACLGSHIKGRLVEHAAGGSALECLKEAKERGILDGDDTLGMYTFIHENVQLAAYRLIPEADRALYHLEIGRRIWRLVAPCGLHRLTFIILAQMQHGRHLITREKERLAVANLCLSAGTAAAKTSTFRTAAVYLDFGIAMLQDRSWRDEYDLTLALYNFAAEVHMSTANFERMDELVDAVLTNSRRLQDMIPAYCTRIYALSVQGQGEQAILTGVDVLAGLGEKFPHRLCGFQLHKLYCKVLTHLNGKSDEVILRMPTIVAAEKLACLQILHLIFITALLSRPTFTPYIVLTMMDITLRHGLSAFSSLAFGYYGMICLQYTNDAKTAFRYGELSLALLDRFQAEEFIPRVHCAFYGCIYPRRKPLRDTLEHLWKAHLVGMRTGDVNAAFLCASLWMLNAFESSVPLPVIEQRMKKCRDLMKTYRQTMQIAVVEPHLHTIDYLMGISDNIDFDPMFDAALSTGNNVTSEYHVPFTRAQQSFFFNEYENARKLQKSIMRKSHLIPPSFKIIAITFMTGLAALVEARRGANVWKNKRFAKKVIKRFCNEFALHSPQNCLGMQFLLEAELAAVQGDNHRARTYFLAAIAMAEANELLYMRAQAYERVAQHLLAIGERKEAFDYFVKTIDAYSCWGALRKVQALEMQLELDYKISRP